MAQIKLLIREILKLTLIIISSILYFVFFDKLIQNNRVILCNILFSLALFLFASFLPSKSRMLLIVSVSFILGNTIVGYYDRSFNDELSLRLISSSFYIIFFIMQILASATLICTKGWRIMGLFFVLILVPSFLNYLQILYLPYVSDNIDYLYFIFIVVTSCVIVIRKNIYLNNNN